MAAEEVEGLAGVAEEEEKEDDVPKATIMSESVRYGPCPCNKHAFDRCLSQEGRLTGSTTH
jgi:hypothetical protein